MQEVADKQPKNNKFLSSVVYRVQIENSNLGS